MSSEVRSQPPQPPQPPQPAGAERRSSERFELLAQVELRRGGEVAVVPTINISAGGVAVRADSGELGDVSVGADVSVLLEVLDLPEPISVAMQGTVVRVEPDETGSSAIAIMWTSSDGGAVAELSRLLDFLRSG